MVFEENFLRLTVTVRFHKKKKEKEYFKKVNFLILSFDQLVWLSQNKFILPCLIII